MKTDFKVGQTIVCINDKKFPDKEVGPPLKEGQEYIVKEIITTAKGHDHLDVGLKSEYNYISCQEVHVNIPRGDEIHWCYPGRFKAV